MAVITEDIVLPHTFVLDDDVTCLKKRIELAKNMASRRYIFVGETHSCLYDRARNAEVADAIAGDADVIVIVERKFFDHLHDSDYRQWVRLTQADNFRFEKVREKVGSFDNVRNIEAVTLAIEEIEKDHETRKYKSPRPVVIFFGQDHEKALRREFQERLTSEPKMCWWSFPSIDEFVQPLKQRTEKDLTAPRALGFALPEPADKHMRVELLRRGTVKSQFTLTVRSSQLVRRHSAGLLAVYAEPAALNIDTFNMAIYTNGRFDLTVTTATPLRVAVRQLEAGTDFDDFHELVAAQETEYANS